MKILIKIILMSIGISLLCILTLGIVSYNYSRDALMGRIDAQLQGITVIKETQLENYFSHSISDLTVFSDSGELIDYMVLFESSHSRYSHDASDVQNDPGPEVVIIDGSSESRVSDLEESYEINLSKKMLKSLNNSEFNELMIITLNGTIDFSTEPSNDKVDVSKEEYFISGKNGVYIQNFHISELSGDTTMMVSMPVIHEGTVLGVIAARLDNSGIAKIMTERSGLGESGETFLVAKDGILLTPSRFMESKVFEKKLSTDAVKLCTAGNSGRGMFKDYRGIDAIILYKWVPEREYCIITKIDEHEVFSTLNILLIVILGCSFLMIAVSVAAAISISRNILNPFEELVEKTKDLSNGKFTRIELKHASDEMESLTKAINASGEALLHAREMEKNYSKNLEEQLNIKTSEMKKNLEELEASKKAALNIMEDLSEINAHLKELDQAKTDFLNIASHELKTPLTAISAYLEILDDYKGQFNEQQLQGLDAIKRNSNQLKMLINNILEVSRLESGRFELNVANMDIEEKLKNMLDNLKILSDTKGIELHHHIDGVQSIYTDVMRFEEIINNLVGNAIKFTDKGSISVDVHKGEDLEENYAVFSITDTGVGIPESKIGNLFQNFYQIDSGISRRYGGTGLGLSITKKIVELQKGKITVQSVVGQGTTFRFTLPLDGRKNKQV